MKHSLMAVWIAVILATPSTPPASSMTGADEFSMINEADE